jgi:hypothetical protein
MTEEKEAAAIWDLCGQDGRAALSMVEAQLNVLHVRAQVLLTLAGVVVTVTGFSGRLIAGTSLLSQGLVLCGLAFVLSAACWVFVRVMAVRWITRDLDLGPLQALSKAITRRNRKTMAYRQGGILLFLGLCLYFVAVGIMLLHPGGPTLPIR